MREKIIRETEKKMKERVAGVGHQMGSIRTGRASATLLDRVFVDYYGTKTPLNQMATVTVPEPQLIVVQPWDKSALQEVEKAILQSDLGITPSNDGNLIRLAFPPLSEERRQELTKVAKKMAEEGRVNVRQIRRDVNDEVKHREKDGEISEDDLERIRHEVQELTDKSIEEIEEVLRKKEEAILEF